jgi:Family of unknown function (DUF6940)
MDQVISNGLTWGEILKKWNNGIIDINWPNYNFQWKCLPFKNLDDKFEYIFIKDDNLQYNKHDISPFLKYINNNCNSAISFWNLNKDSIMIIPNLPKRNANFSTMKTFINDATNDEIKNLFKETSSQIIKVIDNKNKIYLNTHGHGASYLHVRIDFKPKYGYKFLNFNY